MANERQTILRAAVEEFAEVGLKNASLRTVATRSGLEPRAVRALFVDKSALLREVLKEATDPLVSGIALAVSEMDDTRELIREALTLYDQWLLDHPEIVRVLTQCALEGPESLGELYQTSLFPSEFYEHLERVMDGGGLRCRNLFVLNLLIDSLIIFPHMIRPALGLMEPQGTAERAIAARLHAVIDLFENGLYSD